MYRVLRGCSTRVRPYVWDERLKTYIPEMDPNTGKAYPECEAFIDWAPGDMVKEFPKHVPVKEWLDMGVIERVGVRRG